MARPLKWKSHDGASGTGPGVEQSTKGHTEIGLYVEAYDGFDPGTDTLEVRVEGTVTYEGETDPQDFAQLDRLTEDDVLNLTEGDLTESDDNSGRYVGYIGGLGFAVEIVRANIVAYSGTFDVDTTVLVNGSGEAAYRFSTPNSA